MWSRGTSVFLFFRILLRIQFSLFHIAILLKRCYTYGQLQKDIQNEKTVTTCFASVLLLSIFVHKTACMNSVLPVGENIPALQNVMFPVVYKHPTGAKTTGKLQWQILELTEQVNNLQQIIKTLTASSASPGTVSKEKRSRHCSQQKTTETSVGDTSKPSAKKRAAPKCPATVALREKCSRPAFTANLDAIFDLTLWDEEDLKTVMECSQPFIRQKSQYQDIWDEIKQDEVSVKAESRRSPQFLFDNGVVTLWHSNLDTPELREGLKRAPDWSKVVLSNRTLSLNGILELKNDIFLCKFSYEILDKIFGSEVTNRFKKDVCALVIPHMTGGVEQKLQALGRLSRAINTVIFSMSAGMGALDLSRLTGINFELEISDFSFLLSYDIKCFGELNPAKRWKAAVPGARPYCRNKKTTDKAVTSAMRWHMALSNSPALLEQRRSQLRNVKRKPRQ